MRRCVQHLLLLLLVADVAAGATITVRKDGTGNFAVIQQALDVAAAGDTILIGPGEYLEHSTVRLSGWSWDIESYANVKVSDLTIIGAGSDQTFVGPATYSGSSISQSPKALTCLESGAIRISNVSLRNCFHGVFLKGQLFMERCTMDNNYYGVDWVPTGPGGWIKGSQFDFVSPPYDSVALDVGIGGAGNNILIEDCQFEHTKTIVRGVSGLTFRRCEFANSSTGLQVYYTAHVYLEVCTMTNMMVVGVELTMGTGAVCEIRGSTISGNQGTLGSFQSGGQFVVEDSRLEGGTSAILGARDGSGPCVIHNCDLIKGSGPAIVCGSFEPAVVHDLRNNYWGTTSEADIQSWIIDSNDDPNIHATVLYAPFAGQSVPAETTSWGDVKALWR